MGYSFDSSVYRANSFRRRNLLFSLYRARIGFRAIWLNHSHHFPVSTAYTTRAGLCLDCVPVLVCVHVHHSGGVRFRIRSSAAYAGAIY